VTANAASSSPIAEPMPALPAPIAPVHREELPPPPPPVKSATSAPARAAGGPVRPRPHPAGYLMNTELLNLLIFSVPVEVGPARSDPGKTGPGEDPGQDRTSALPGPDIPPVIAHQAYRHGAQARAAAWPAPRLVRLSCPLARPNTFSQARFPPNGNHSKLA
jgi:hypothetical protein